MPNVTANGIQIEYDTFGDSSSAPILLIIGLGSQMIFWDENLCKKLAEEGLYVIRFDNRDSGLSTKFDEAGVPDIMEVFTARMKGEEITSPYTLDDMADDAVGLLEALGIEKAHICGVSMGAAIAQTVAIRHPSRVLSLISIYGSTGNPALPMPKPEAFSVFITPPPEERDGFIQHVIDGVKTLAGPGFPFDEEWHRKIAGQAYDRSFYPQGVDLQMAAVVAHGNRKPALASVTAPTLVIHGTDDPIALVEGGKDTAEAIPGSELLLIEGMGHDLPNGKGAWSQIIEAIVDHTRKVAI
ncbi:MAG: alpha/beta fold hydrolase [Proteobacteria bacterium]|nr:alpha/beta fold hydrolase [Pseudomonadota bacterium]